MARSRRKAENQAGRNYITDDVVAKIRRLLEAHITYAETAEICDVSFAFVQQVAQGKRLLSTEAEVATTEYCVLCRNVLVHGACVRCEALEHKEKPGDVTYDRLKKQRRKKGDPTPYRIEQMMAVFRRAKELMGEGEIE